MQYTKWIVLLLVLLFTSSAAQSVVLGTFEDDNEFLCRVFDEKVNRYSNSSEKSSDVEKRLERFEERANKYCNNYFNELNL